MVLRYTLINNLKNWNSFSQHLLHSYSSSPFKIKNKNYLSIFNSYIPSSENNYLKNMNYEFKNKYCNKKLVCRKFNNELLDLKRYAVFRPINHFYKFIPQISLDTIRYSKTFSALQQKEAHLEPQTQNINKEKNVLWKSKGIISDLEETKVIVKEKFGEIIERENIYTIPNLLCISRIAVAPFLCYSVISSYYTLAFGMFLVAGFTDLIDGIIARKFPSQASRLGSFLDPLADKILVSSLFLTLTYVGLIPFILTGIIVYRDIAIIAGASYIRYTSLPPPHTLSRYFDATHATAQLNPTFISKMNTAVQIGLITLSLGAPVFAYTDHYLLQALWFMTGFTTLASGIGYIFSKDTFLVLSSTSKRE